MPPNVADAKNAQTGVVASLVAAWTSDVGPCRVRQGPALVVISLEPR